MGGGGGGGSLASSSMLTSRQQQDVGNDVCTLKWCGDESLDLSAGTDGFIIRVKVSEED